LTMRTSKKTWKWRRERYTSLNERGLLFDRDEQWGKGSSSATHPAAAYSERPTAVRSPRSYLAFLAAGRASSGSSKPMIQRLVRPLPVVVLEVFACEVVAAPLAKDDEAI